ncbi:MAG TPA: TonB-dependent receptor plug domain-containing protein [Gemmatimonadales bacterium]|jgi:TonB-dependent SusC/RagA subfamily outer membrane receptor|nr:TonB-dependent receptor plug domain-containing protein [Gemmatimonadales bacterium]
MLKLITAVLLAWLPACAMHKRDSAPPPPPPPAAQSSITTITAEDIEHAPGLSLEQLLVTRVPGLSLSRAPDGHLVIHIRGTTTLLGDQEPLFIVNDLPLENPVGGNLSSINPRDIESIQVLRDAASTAMYGLRGSNGVIIIKMKGS